MVLFFQMLLFFPMLPQWLPPGHSVQSPPRSGNFSAQTSASLHPSRSAALAPLSLCCTGSLTLRCTGAPESVLHWSPCRQHLMGTSGSALYRRPVPATPHGRLKLCAVPAPPDSVLHWVSDSALHRVFDSALHWCPCRAAASFGREELRFG